MGFTGDPLPKGHPGVMKAIGAFWVFSAMMASSAAITLLRKGTILDRVWVLNPRAYEELARFGRAAGIPFLLLSVALIVTAAGWFRRRLWGWRLAVAILAAQVLGGFLNALRGRVIEGGAGLVLAGAFLFYLSRARIRAAFQT